MRRLILPLLVLLCLALPASAHSLRVFAKVEGDRIGGYAFFIGGGRPNGATWTARMGEAPLAAGKTDAEGGFAFAAPDPVTATITVTVDTGDGHVASADLGPERFGAGAASLAAGAIGTRPAQPLIDMGASQPDRPAPALSAQDTAALVEAAVERQVAPLLERIEAMDARLRITDIVSGIFLIFGLAGMALWALGRRR